MRSETTRSILMLAAGTLTALIVLLSSCSPIRRAERTGQCRELLESYYITRENPENNTPNEQDSIIELIKQEVK